MSPLDIPQSSLGTIILGDSRLVFFVCVFFCGAAVGLALFITVFQCLSPELAYCLLLPTR